MSGSLVEWFGVTRELFPPFAGRDGDGPCGELDKGAWHIFFTSIEGIIRRELPLKLKLGIQQFGMLIADSARRQHC